MPNIQKSLEKGLGWTIDLVIDNDINVSKYKHLAGRSYIELPKELNHTKNIGLMF